MIVKVQMSLSNTDDRMGFVYPQDRKVQTVQKLGDDVMAVLMARPTRKAYFEAEIEKLGGYFVIGRQVEDQEW